MTRTANNRLHELQRPGMPELARARRCAVVGGPNAA